MNNSICFIDEFLYYECNIVTEIFPGFVYFFAKTAAKVFFKTLNNSSTFNVAINK